MPFQSSDALDDQMLLDGSNGFSTGVISATRPDAIPATSMEEAINMDYDDFGNLVTRLGTISLTGNSESRNWEDIITNWESTTSNFASNLPTNSQVFSGFSIGTPVPRISTTDHPEFRTTSSAARRSTTRHGSFTSRSSTTSCSTRTAIARCVMSRARTPTPRSLPARSAASM
jgi:hypothetical protein